MSDAPSQRCCREDYEAWLAACDRGDEAAAQAACDALARCLCETCAGLARWRARSVSGVEAEDLLQEAWRRLQTHLGKPPSERGPGFPLSLFRIALRSATIDAARRHKTRRLVAGGLEGVELPPAEEPGVGQAAEASEAQARVHETLQRLSASALHVDRVAVDLLTLHYLEGLSAPQIAVQLGRTTGAVEQALRRARMRFSAAFGARPGAPQLGSGEAL
ncbi:MAG: RNA polymerase sigma factor [Planctomycetes bacterium]|nr:RNA polymerase sigma factor [Planctomycetota bacterium]